MANLVIVTDQCYLLCETINFISVSEVDEKEGSSIWSKNSRSKTKKIKNKKEEQEYIDKEMPFSIIINFMPIIKSSTQTAYSSKRDDAAEVTVTVRGHTRCLMLYKSIVTQIREQMPDQLYLDQVVEKFLTST